MEEGQEEMQEQEKQLLKHGNSSASVKFSQSQSPRLQDCCPTGVHSSMVITYPTDVVKFQIVCHDPEPELEGLQRVSINIEDNNFPQIIPDRHIQFLDKLKQHKIPATEEPSAKLKKSKVARSTTDPLPRDN
ncbi:MAG: hypothetical protein J3R72DRAFT_493487 [Linnemannia gamsii]|nr:MAG: hypothetical protein J3R72DRAFT_493487 [Linnemannia gamsii]